MMYFNPPPPSDIVRKEDLFSSVLSQFKRFSLSGNPKFVNLSISQSLESRILMKTILSITLKLNFTPNTLGCYGLNILRGYVIWGPYCMFFFYKCTVLYSGSKKNTLSKNRKCLFLVVRKFRKIWVLYQCNLQELRYWRGSLERWKERYLV